MPLSFIFGLGPLEFIIIAVIIIVLFLPTALPRIARRFGETLTSLREAAKSADEANDEDE
jgi:sec-independent protein translocase protein TatA